MLEYTIKDKTLTIFLADRIDNTNAAETGRQIDLICNENEHSRLILDCDTLTYCSSVGLRMILRLKKSLDATIIENAHTELYEILELTGFTDIIEVHKAYRILSVENCPLIGEGANGLVYRLNADTVVKVCRKSDAFSEIRREQALARKAFVAGIPTAIPYDVVRIEGGGYGSVFEMLNAENLAQMLVDGQKTVTEAAKMSMELLRFIHSKEPEDDGYPDAKQKELSRVISIREYLPLKAYEKLKNLVEAVPDDKHLLHGDFNPKNIICQNGECLLIDMDTLGFGHPIFELAGLYNVLVGYGEFDPAYQQDFTGIPHDLSKALWKESLKCYLNSTESRGMLEVENKAKLIGLGRIIRREIRRGGMESEQKRRLIEYSRNELIALLPRVESLTF